MNDYKIKMLQNASEDLDNIYYYIKNQFKEESTARRLIRDLQRAIQSLKLFPHRCAVRKVGKFKNKKYRQLFVRNFTVIYRIDEANKMVIIVTIRYKFSDF